MLILVLPVSYYRNNHVDIFSYMVDVVITLFAVVRIFFGECPSFGYASGYYAVAYMERTHGRFGGHF